MSSQQSYSIIKYDTMILKRVSRQANNLCKAKKFFKFRSRIKFLNLDLNIYTVHQHSYFVVGS
jgi:hypothetical protein